MIQWVDMILIVHQKDILAASYRNSYFNIHDYKIKHNTLLAGNVIGDWAKDRLITDIRNPRALKRVIVEVLNAHAK
jgi:CDP-glucose 4,6-dehydratase